MPDPVFTPEQLKEDGTNRVSKTGIQNATGAAVVTVATWAAQQAGWDGKLPVGVRDALVLLLTVSTAAWMNRKRLRGES